MSIACCWYSQLLLVYCDFNQVLFMPVTEKLMYWKNYVWMKLVLLYCKVKYIMHCIFSSLILNVKPIVGYTILVYIMQSY